MERREFLGTTGVAVLAAASAGGDVRADAHGKTGFLLVHGSWGGGWVWAHVVPHLVSAGHATVSIDLPGSGLNAVSPPSYYERPLDPAKFATEPSQFAEIPTEAFADAVLDAAEHLRAMGVEQVIAVGHSMGGMPITLAAAKDPAAIQGLVFLTAVTTVPGKPAGAFFGIPEQQEQGKLSQIFMADPAKIGGLRIDPRSTDSEYYAAGKLALASDVPDDLYRTGMGMLNPDAPVAFYGQEVEFPAVYASIQRTYLRCAQDKTLTPGYQDALIAAMNEAWPDNPCAVTELDVSHMAQWADAQGVAKALIAAA